MIRLIRGARAQVGGSGDGVAHRVRAVVYVKASNALEGADRWVRDEHDDMDGPSRPMSEDVAEVAEVRA